MPSQVVILLLLIPNSAFAIFDFIGNQAQRAMEISAYVSTASDLVKEVSGNNDVEAGAKDVRKRTEALRKSNETIKHMSETSKSILLGPNWTSKRLDENIRSTTNYVKRIKSIIAKSAMLGTSGLTALNSTESNISLNEIQKNQQTLILQNEDARLRQMERENEEISKWHRFSVNQRNLRENKARGKLN